MFSQQKQGRSYRSSKSCSLSSKIRRNQRVSFSSIIVGWNSSQRMRHSTLKKRTNMVDIIFQIVKGNLVQSLNVNVCDTTTWAQVHMFPISYLNNSALQDTRLSTSSIPLARKKRSLPSRKAKRKVVTDEKDLSKENDQKGLHMGLAEGQIKRNRKTKSQGKGHWTTWSWNQNSRQDSRSELESKRSKGSQKNNRRRQGHVSGLRQMRSSWPIVLVEPVWEYTSRAVPT